MALTPGQQAAVVSAHEPLFIQAGAGTGKTFTLTKRVAHGLSRESGPLIGGVDRMLTITFTNKAAGELVGRIRAELRKQGLAEEALQIDAAWISTIHSMCRRMLLAHAFDVRIDPGANLLTEDETQALAALALDELMHERAGDAGFIALIDAFGVEGCTRLISDLSTLLALSPQGTGAFDLGPGVPSARMGVQSVHRLLGIYGDALAEAEAADIPLDKPTYAGNHRAMTDTVAALTVWLENADHEPTWQDISELLAGIAPLRGGSFKAPFKELFAACKGALIEAQAQAQCAVTAELLQAGIVLAAELVERHRALKRYRGALDTNDLLIAAYRLLADDPEVAREYAGSFDSIMVDEFQDTDSLQVGIVSSVCKPDLSNLATVGDAQQSIYGFRGADLEVYQQMRSTMAACGSKEVELAVNFRSQPDILCFVEDIFAKPEFFGAGFFKVEAGRAGGAHPPWLGSDDARVKILLSAGTKASEGAARTAVSALRRADAAAVADEFERLHAQGAPYGSMAILMQSTKQAYSGAYLQELRSRGIPCVIAGGSDFYALPEIACTTMLLRVLADVDDDEALFALLGSDMFSVSDDELLELAVIAKQRLKLLPEDVRPKPSLFDALRFAVRDEAVPAPARLVRALQVIDDARAALAQPFALVVRNAVRASGWEATLRRAGAAGGAAYANIERMCDMIEDHEQLDGHSIFATSEFFREMVDLAVDGKGARAKPGTLISTGAQAVQLMTIHSSKGLEFPIVAVAEFEKSARRSAGEVLALTEDGARHLALGFAGSDSSTKYLTQEAPDPGSFARATSAESFRTHAHHLAARRAAEEQQRLLYVALTRARDVLLFVTHDAAFASKGELSPGLTAQCLQAVFDGPVPTADATMKTHAGAMVELKIREVPYQEGGSADDFRSDGSGDEGRLVVEHAVPLSEPACVISSAPRHEEQVYSYSSISKHAAQPEREPVAAQIFLRDRAAEVETVSPVGSAFHLVAQWIAFSPHAHESIIAHRLKSASARYGLCQEERLRLVDAVKAWVLSSRYEQIAGFAHVHAEYPFCVDIEGVPLEGFIDLLCLDDEGGALIIDYKTGTSGTYDELRRRYRLQACCYAYAVLFSGLCDHVELAFVRPEADMQEVDFAFTEQDLPELIQEIMQA